MSYTNEQYQALCELIASGAQSVAYGDGRSMTSRPLADMLKLKSMMEKELGISVTYVRRTLVEFAD